jgi:type I restriction enzyme M protein
MEACIVICRTNKPESRRGKILLINAANEATRKNAQSWLEEEHIKKIAGAYEKYADIDGFAKVINIEDAVNNGYSLSIPLYVKEANAEKVDSRPAKECAASWIEKASGTWKEYENLTALLGGVKGATQI